MFKDFIKQEAGVEIYPIISLCVFVAFFVVLSFMAMMYSKSSIKAMSAIPLDGNDFSNNTMEGNSHESK